MQICSTGDAAPAPAPAEGDAAPAPAPAKDDAAPAPAPAPAPAEGDAAPAPAPAPAAAEDDINVDALPEFLRSHWTPDHSERYRLITELPFAKYGELCQLHVGENNPRPENRTVSVHIKDLLARPQDFMTLTLGGTLYLEVDGVYDSASKRENLQEYKGLVRLLKDHPPEIGFMYIYLVDTKRGERTPFPDPNLLRTCQEDLFYNKWCFRGPNRLLAYVTFVSSNCPINDTHRLAKAVFGSSESNFHRLDKNVTLEELGCKSPHIPKVILAQALCSGEHLIQVVKPALAGLYPSLCNLSPNEYTINGATQIIKQLGGEEGRAFDAGLSANGSVDTTTLVLKLNLKLAEMFGQVTDPKLQKKLGQRALVSPRYFKDMNGAEPLENWARFFNKSELRMMGNNPRLQAAILFMRLAQEQECCGEREDCGHLKKLLLFDWKYNVITVEGAIHGGEKKDGKALFGGFTIDKVWGGFGCPQYAWEPNYLCRSADGSPYQNVFGQGHSVSRAAYDQSEADDRQRELACMFLGLRQPYDGQNDRLCAAQILDHFFDSVYLVHSPDVPFDQRVCEERDADRQRRTELRAHRLKCQEQLADQGDAGEPSASTLANQSGAGEPSASTLEYADLITRHVNDAGPHEEDTLWVFKEPAPPEVRATLVLFYPGAFGGRAFDIDAVGDVPPGIQVALSLHPGVKTVIVPPTANVDNRNIRSGFLHLLNWKALKNRGLDSPGKPRLVRTNGTVTLAVPPNMSALEAHVFTPEITAWNHDGEVQRFLYDPEVRARARFASPARTFH